MKLELRKKENIIVDTWVNERKITDSTWNVYVDSETEDTIYIILKGKDGNQVKINIKKFTDFEEIKSDKSNSIKDENNT